MRRLYVILLALTLSTVTLVATVLPVAADPRDNQPVAWVNFSGSDNGLHSNAEWNQRVSFPLMVSIAATRRADGTTVGHAFDRVLDPRSEDNFAVLDSHFSVRGDGARVADILLFSDPDEAGLSWYSWWQLIDAGEPGRGIDTWQMFIWAEAFVDFGPPLTIGFSPDGYPTPWPPVFTPGVILGVPKWYQYPVNALPPGNIQVHITDQYVP